MSCFIGDFKVIRMRKVMVMHGDNDGGVVMVGYDDGCVAGDNEVGGGGCGEKVTIIDIPGRKIKDWLTS